MITVAVSLVAIMLGTVGGLLLALIRLSGLPLASGIIATYVSLVRATPLVTLSLLIFFGLPSLGLQLSPIIAGIAALTISTTGFQAEIWRAALSSFPRGQVDAAKAAGMTAPMSFRRIILPQAARASLPALVNEMTLLIKASPAVAVIGVVDLTRVAVRITSVTYDPLPPFLTATLIYIVGVMLLIRLQRTVERRIVEKYGIL